MADEQEDGVRGRLLKQLEQRVGAGALHVVGGVHDDDANGREAWRGRKQSRQATDLVDGDRAREILGLVAIQPLEQHDVGVAASLPQLDDAMVGGRLDAGQLDRRAGGVGQEPERGGARKTALADALGPGEQPGVVHTAGRASIEDGGSRGGMAVYRHPALRSHRAKSR